MNWTSDAARYTIYAKLQHHECTLTWCHRDGQGDLALTCTRERSVVWFRYEALVVCSAAADFKIAEVVDMPKFVVTMHIPLAIAQ